MLTLYDYYRSSACFRVRIALNLKKLDYQKVSIHLTNHGGEQFSDAYHQINPQHLVPALKDNHHVLTQSLAIIEYLDELYPTPPLLSSDSLTKAKMRSFALSIAADLHPLNNLRVLTYLTQQCHLTEEQKRAWYQHWIHQGLKALEQQLLTDDQSTLFCFSDFPSLADICLVPQLFNARRFACDLTAYPTLVKIDANCQQIPAFKQAWPTENAT